MAIIYFYVCLSLSHCVSVFTLPALPTNRIMASSTRTDGLRFTRGRTQASRNVVFEGFRYGTPKELVTGQTSWVCIEKLCSGRIYTLSDTHVQIRKEHNHDSDLSYCNAKLAVNKAKDQAEISRTGAKVIIADATGPLTNAECCRLPSGPAIKKQLQRVRALKDGRPLAPKCVADIEINAADCVTQNGQTMLLYDNFNPEHRLIIFGTEQCLRLLERYTSWFIDGTFQKCPEHFYQLVTIHADCRD